MNTVNKPYQIKQSLRMITNCIGIITKIVPKITDIDEIMEVRHSVGKMQFTLAQLKSSFEGLLQQNQNISSSLHNPDHKQNLHLLRNYVEKFPVLPNLDRSIAKPLNLQLRTIKSSCDAMLKLIQQVKSTNNSEYDEKQMSVDSAASARVPQRNGCWNCESSDHHYSRCPHPIKKCIICGRIGHEAGSLRQCKKYLSKSKPRHSKRQKIEIFIFDEKRTVVIELGKDGWCNHDLEQHVKNRWEITRFWLIRDGKIINSTYKGYLPISNKDRITVLKRCKYADHSSCGQSTDSFDQMENNPAHIDNREDRQIIVPIIMVPKRYLNSGSNTQTTAVQREHSRKRPFPAFPTEDIANSKRRRLV